VAYERVKPTFIVITTKDETFLLWMEIDETTKTHLVYQPNAEDHLHRVVNYQHILEVKRLPVLHPARSRGTAEVSIGDEDRQKWHRATH
jgi:hypothetical protein